MEIAGRYELVREIARGASGRVHLARDLAGGRLVALKVLDGAADSEAAMLSRNEFALLSGLRHPNLVELLDIGRDASTGAPFLAMEYVEGEPLVERLLSASEEKAIDLLIQSARALAFVHSRGLLHRDLKPANILVRPDGVLKIVDFGLASELAARREAPAGTLVYLPPEVLTGQTADARSDLYSLGLSFFHASTGRAPFEEETRGAIVEAITEGRFPPAGAVFPPGVLGRALERLTAPQPAARFASAGDLIRYLDLAAGGVLGLESAETERSYLTASHMVGREQERQRLSEAIGAIVTSEPEARRPPLVLVGGEAGIGKSRLIVEFRREAVRAGVETILVQCPESGASPLYPFGLVLRALTPPPSETATPRGERHARLAALLLGEGAATAPDGDAEAPELRVAREKSRLFDLFTRFLLEAVSTTPLVVILEDLHWADAPTLEMLAHLGLNARGSRLLLVASHRVETESSEEFARWLAEAAGREFCARLRLERLGEDEVGQMLGVMFEGAEVDPRLARSLARESGGNPFFLLEILRFLQSENALSRTASGWRLPELEQVRATLPQDLERALAKRLANLGGDEARVLGALAVLTRPAGPELTARLAGLAEEDCSGVLASLASQGLLTRSGSRGRYVFEHALIRRAAEERLGTDDRASLHLRAAAILEQDAPDEPGSVEEIARHLAEGGVPDRAARFEEKAGDLALARRAASEAARHYEKAMALTAGDRSASRSGLLLKAGNGRLASGDLDRARAHFEALLTSVEGTTDEARRARALERLGTVLGFQKTGEEGIPFVTEALDLFRRLGDLAGEARALHNLGIRHARQSRYAEALPNFHAALGVHEKRGDGASMADERNSLGLVECFIGRYDEAGAHLEKAAELAIATDYEYLLAASRHNLGIVRRNQGRPEEALASVREALAIFDEIGHRSGYCASLINVGLYSRASGLLEEALETFRRARAALAQAGETSREVYALECEADLLRFLGQPLTAIDRLTEAVRVAVRASDERQRGYATAALARALLDAGRTQEALEKSRAALSIGEKAQTPRLIARSLLALAAASLASGEPAEAAARARELLARGAAEITLEDMAAEANLLLASAMLDLADVPASKDSLARGRDAIRARDVRHLTPLATRIEARIARVSGDVPGAAALEWRADEERRALAARLNDETLRRSFLSAVTFEWPRPHAPAGAGAPSGGSPVAALRTLYEISGLVGSDHALDEVLNRVLDLALGMVGAARGLIILIDEASEAYEVRTSRGVEKQTAQDATRYSRSVVKAAGEGESVLTIDAGSDERFSRFRSISLFRIKSLMCVPLRVRSRIIGTVYVDSGDAGRVFTKDDLAFLEAFASQAAVAIENARLYARLAEENRILRRATQERFRFENFVGESEAMRKVFDLMERAAGSPLPVLVLGESGTGKELVARALHFNSPRRARAYLSENCAAIPETLLESELFGYVQGAFTGADRDKKGLFELADGGTLFLDEVGDMPPPMQAKLLRVLQDGEFRPIGSKQARTSSARIVAATNADLRQRIAEGRFREDLYYRLNVVAIELPPLRARKGDVPALVTHFLEKASRDRGLGRMAIDDDLLALLIRYSWPGNVRQLENVIARLAILARTPRLTMRDLEVDTTLYEQLAEFPAESQAVENLSTLERKQILKALQETGRNRLKAARLLGISRATIFRKIREYGIE